MNAPLPHSISQASLAGHAIDTATREDIADLLERYAHALDDDRVDEWSNFFAQDAVYQVTTRENVKAGRPVGIVLCEGRGMMDDRVKALKIANIFESHTHRHVLGRPVMNQQPDGSVHSRSSFVIYRTMYTGQTDVFATGCYDDVLQRGPQGWCFRSRRVVLDSRLLDTLLVYPL